jgi:glycosyltransferase involved in cell wall biosynthesis
MPQQKRLCIICTGKAMPHFLAGKGPEEAGGVEVQLSLLVHYLLERSWQIEFIVQSFDGMENSPAEGLCIIPVRERRGGIPGLRLLTHTLRSSWHALTQTDSDVYLKSGIGWQTGLLAWWCQRHGKRFVFWSASRTDPMCADRQHSRISKHERWLATYGLRHASAVIVQTAEQQRLMSEYHNLASTIVPNIWPIRPDSHEEPASPPEVFWAARVIELKRPHWVLDLAERLPQLRFVMAGAVDEGKEALHAEIRARASTIRNVEFLGFVPFSEIDTYYARASAYLCTSTIEGFPNTFLQAWSHGRPVVTTFDPDGIVARYKLGFSCQAQDELATALVQACQQSADYADRVAAYLATHHAPAVIIPRVEHVLLGTRDDRS